MREALLGGTQREGNNQIDTSQELWKAAFTDTNELVGLTSTTLSGDKISFCPQRNGEVRQVPEWECEWDWYIQERVRVIAYVKKKWQIDPNPSKLELDSRLWVYGNKPLARLVWHLGEWVWKDPFIGGKHFQFFQFTMKLGRYIQSANSEKMPSVAKYWEKQGLFRRINDNLFEKLKVSMAFDA